MNEAPQTIEIETAGEDAIFWDRDGELQNLVSTMHQGASGLIVEDLLADYRKRPIDDS